MRTRWTTLSLTFAWFLTLAACTNTAPAEGEGDPTDLPEGSGPGVGPGSQIGGPRADAGSAADSEPPPPPCDPNEASVIQATLDAAHPDKTDIVATIKTPSCGVRYFASGPTKTTAEILHRIASVTKTYTGAIVMKLVEEGLLKLDDPAATWLDGVPGGNAITVRHLLRHQSGLSQGSTNYSSATTPQDLLTTSFKKGTSFTPGSKFEYQNINFVAAGVIAEKVSGKTLPSLIRERITTKIGATATFFEGQDTISGTIAVPRNGTGGAGSYSIHPSQVWGAGSIVATPGDAALWIEQFGSGQFFTAPMVDEIRKVVSMAEGFDYGLAMMEILPSKTFGGGPGRGHFGDLMSANLLGGTVGYHTGAFYFPERKTTVVVIQDYTPSDTKTVRDPFFAVLKTLFSGK